MSVPLTVCLLAGGRFFKGCQVPPHLELELYHGPSVFELVVSESTDVNVSRLSDGHDWLYYIIIDVQHVDTMLDMKLFCRLLLSPLIAASAGLHLRLPVKELDMTDVQVRVCLLPPLMKTTR